MNFKQLVNAIAAETEIPADVVRKVSLAMLKKFAFMIDNQTNFASPVVTLTSVTVPAKPAIKDKPAIPERKFARMAVRPKKSAVDID